MYVHVRTSCVHKYIIIHVEMYACIDICVYVCNVYKFECKPLSVYIFLQLYTYKVDFQQQR